MRLVCKQWNYLVSNTWKSKISLILDEENLYGKKIYVSNSNKTPLNFLLYTNTLNRFNASKIKHLELRVSTNERQILSVCDLAAFLEIISRTCFNLAQIKLISSAKFMHDIFPNNIFIKLVQNNRNLVRVDLKNFYGIVDSSLEALFDSCPNLETLNLKNCALLIGICFKKVNHALKILKIDSCSNIEEENLIILLNRNRNFRELAFHRFELNSKIAPGLISTLKNLEQLEITNEELNELFKLDLRRDENFNILATSNNLVKLNLSHNKIDNSKQFASILENCHLLKYLNVNYCRNLTDEMFTACSVINAPLENLLMTDLDITKVTLHALKQKKISLKKLSIRKCKKIGWRSIGNAIEDFVNLEFYDVRETHANNFLLLNAKLLTDFDQNRNINLKCQKTSVDIFELDPNYPCLTNSDLKIDDIVHFSYDFHKNYSTDMRVKYKTLVFDMTRPEFTSCVYDLDWSHVLCRFEFLKPNTLNLKKENFEA